MRSCRSLKRSSRPSKHNFLYIFSSFFLDKNAVLDRIAGTNPDSVPHHFLTLFYSTSAILDLNSAPGQHKLTMVPGTWFYTTQHSQMKLQSTFGAFIIRVADPRPFNSDPDADLPFTLLFVRIWLLTEFRIRIRIHIQSYANVRSLIYRHPSRQHLEPPRLQCERPAVQGPSGLRF